MTLASTAASCVDDPLGCPGKSSAMGTCYILARGPGDKADAIVTLRPLGTGDLKIADALVFSGGQPTLVTDTHGPQLPLTMSRLGAIGGTVTEAQVRDLSAAGTLVPLCG